MLFAGVDSEQHYIPFALPYLNTAINAPADTGSNIDSIPSLEASEADFSEISEERDEGVLPTCATAKITLGSVYWVPLLVNNERCLPTFYDCGANFSTITTAYAESLGIESVPILITIDTFNGKKTDSSLRSKELVKFTIVGKEVSQIVMISNTLPHKANCIIGTDLGDKLGIYPTNIPSDFADTPTVSTLPPKDDIPPVAVDPTGEVSDEERAAFISQLQIHLDANWALPEGEFCNIPDSVLVLQEKIEGDQSMYVKQFQVAERLQPFVTEVVDGWLAEGVIEPAPPGCRYNSPIFPVIEKDPFTGVFTGKIRVVIDSRKVNNNLRPGDRFPIPNVTELFQELAGYMYYSELDLRKGFNQFMVHKDSRPMTAFTWLGSQWMFVGCPFGLEPLPSFFQRNISRVFRDVSFVKVFMDNIIIRSKSKREHLEHLIIVIERLTAAHLKLGKKKNQILYTALDLLGHEFSREGTKCSEEKISIGMRMPRPERGKQVEALLGFFNFLRAYIPRYADIAAPLDELRKIDRLGDKWDIRHDQALAQMKAHLSAKIQLTHPNFEELFKIGTDASQFAVGGMLYQDYDGKRHYIMFISRSLHASERKYSAVHRELLGIIFCLTRFHYFIWGRQFHLYTDSRALTFIFTQKVLTPMLMGWLDTILAYKFTIFHCLGIQNVLPDCLSRLWPMFSLNHPKAPTSAVATISELDMQLVPEDQRNEVLAVAHLKGHFGAKAIVDTLRSEGMQWPGMTVDALHTYKNCLACQKFQVTKAGFHPMASINTLLPADYWCLDSAGPFDESPEGFKYLVIFVCAATRFVVLKPQRDLEQTSTAQSMLEVFCIFGFPRVLQHDNGTEYVNTLVKALVALSGINNRVTLPYHTRANGITEIKVKLAKQVIYKQLDGLHSSWTRYVASTQLFINIKVAELHKSTPMSLMFGRGANAFIDYSSAPLNCATEEELQGRLEYMNSIIYPAVLKASLAKSAERKTKFAQDNKIITQSYIPLGAIVLKADPTVNTSSKPVFNHQAKVVGYGRHGSYVLQNLDGTLLPRNTPPSHVRLFKKSSSQLTRSVEIKCLVDHKLAEGQSPATATSADFLYRVEWVGPYSVAAPQFTWEPIANFDDLECVRTYWKRNQLAAHEAPLEFSQTNLTSTALVLYTPPLLPLASPSGAAFVPRKATMANTRPNLTAMTVKSKSGVIKIRRSTSSSDLVGGNVIYHGPTTRSKASIDH